MAAGSYLGLCFRARALDLKVLLKVEPAKDPSKNPSRLSELALETGEGKTVGIAYLFPGRDNLDEAADLVLEQIPKGEAA